MKMVKRFRYFQIIMHIVCGIINNEESDQVGLQSFNLM